MVEFDRSAFISKFQEEATDLLQRLNEGVITLEGDPGNRELIEQMLRDAHTLKGSSRMVGLMEISDIAHKLEDIMVRIRDGELAYTMEMSDAFFAALDAIVYLTDNAGKDTSELDLEGLVAQLVEIARQGLAVEAAEQAGEASLVADDEPAEASDGVVELTDGEVDAIEAAEREAREAGRESPQRVQREDTLTTRVQHTVRIRTSQVDRLLNLVSEVVISQIKAEQRAREMRRIQARAHEANQLWTRM
jgi:Chemotaxis protein histidine kinase and related kinases